jgi:hypothetical protein
VVPVKVFAENLSSPLRSPYGGILGFCWLVKSFDELISESKERDIPLALPLWGEYGKTGIFDKKN